MGEIGVGEKGKKLPIADMLLSMRARLGI